MVIKYVYSDEQEETPAPKPWRPGKRQIVAFNPKFAGRKRKIEPAFDHTPRFLLRVHDAYSRGTTTTSFVSSAHADTSGTCGNDILRERAVAAAADLYNHLTWKDSPDDNLVSWTSSLLFALQYALYRHNKKPVFVDDKDDMSQVFILVVDTWAFPRRTFIKDRNAINCLKRHDARLLSFSKNVRTKKRYHFGEYLSQSCINVKGHAAQASLQQIVDAGLFDICPFFRDRVHWEGCAKRVAKLRGDLRESSGVFKSTDGTRAPERIPEVRRAVAIAEACFGGRFSQPFASMLLAISFPEALGNSAMRALLRIYADVLQEDVGCRDKIEEVEVSIVPYEVQRYRDIVRELRVHLDEEKLLFTLLVESNKEREAEKKANEQVAHELLEKMSALGLSDHRKGVEKLSVPQLCALLDNLAL